MPAGFPSLRIAMLAAFLFFNTPVMAQESIPDANLDRSKPLVVMIEGELISDQKLPKKQTKGAGIVFAVFDGWTYIATAYHVLHDDDGFEAENLKVWFFHGSKEWPVENSSKSILIKYVESNPSRGITVIGVKQDFQDFPWSRVDPSALGVGRNVYSIGNTTASLHWHTVSHHGETGHIGSLDFDVEDPYIDPGDSGGVFTDQNGMLVGMIETTTRSNAKALKIDEMIKFLKSDLQKPIPVKLGGNPPTVLTKLDCQFTIDPPDKQTKDSRSLVAKPASRPDTNSVKVTLILCPNSECKLDRSPCPLTDFISMGSNISVQAVGDSPPYEVYMSFPLELPKGLTGEFVHRSDTVNFNVGRDASIEDKVISMHVLDSNKNDVEVKLTLKVRFTIDDHSIDDVIFAQIKIAKCLPPQYGVVPKNYGNAQIECEGCDIPRQSSSRPFLHVWRSSKEYRRKVEFESSQGGDSADSYAYGVCKLLDSDSKRIFDQLQN